MKLERSTKRMTLRELMTHGDVTRLVNDLRDLNRPVRRKSNYPTMLALQNALQKVEEASEEGMVFCDYLIEQMETIRDNALREVRSRV